MRIFDMRLSTARMLGGTNGQTRFPVHDMTRAMLDDPLPRFLQKLEEQAPPDGEVEIYEGPILYGNLTLRTSFGAHLRTNFVPLDPKALARLAAERMWSYLLILQEEEQPKDHRLVYLVDMQDAQPCQHDSVKLEAWLQSPFGPIKFVEW